MPRLSAYKGKFKSKNCNNMQMLMIYNKGLHTTTAENTPSNNVATNSSDTYELFCPIITTKHLHSCKSKRIGKNSEYNDLKSKQQSPPCRLQQLFDPMQKRLR